jgi:hypothetical protein
VPVYSAFNAKYLIAFLGISVNLVQSGKNRLQLEICRDKEVLQPNIDSNPMLALLI